MTLDLVRAFSLLGTAPVWLIQSLKSPGQGFCVCEKTGQADVLRGVLLISRVCDVPIVRGDAPELQDHHSGRVQLTEDAEIER